MKSVRQDLLTKEEFLPKRSNQKFAKPENRIRYYNNKANALRHSLAFVTKPLQKNFLILCEMLWNKTEETFHRQYFEGKGFSFKVHTHFEFFDNKKHVAIFNYIIVPLNHDQIKVIKR